VTSAFKTLPWRRIMPVAGIAGVLWVAFDTGRDNERSKWQRASIAAERAAQAKSAALQAQVDAAGVALSEKQQQIADMANVQKVNTRTFYVQNVSSNVRCLTDDRLRAISEADAAVTAASTAQ
jgi:hypothetical protein